MASPTDKAAIKALQEELADPAHLRDEAEINRDIATLEGDAATHQANFDTELDKVRKASDYLSYILVHSTNTRSEPNHYIRRLHQNENGFESWRLLRLCYSGGHRGRLFLAAEHPGPQMVRTTSASSVSNMDGRSCPL